jgi:thymidylate synthase
MTLDGYLPTNDVWQSLIKRVSENYTDIVSPRDMKVKEIRGGSYTVSMPAYITLADRNVNYAFMFAEAAWIVEGSNRLDKIEPYMKYYATFSDDGEFMSGAYGPKIVDQMKYIVDSLEKDRDSRQAYLNIWRERPGQSKDIPCTCGMQFLIRKNKLHMIVNMRSNDVVKGFTYDVFTFSMVAKAIQLSLTRRNIFVDMGDLQVTAGSLHLYESDEKNLDKWVNASKLNFGIQSTMVDLYKCNSQSELIDKLWCWAAKWKETL